MLRRGNAKHIFLVALAAMLALLVFLFARRSVDSQMALEREYPRKNMALTLSAQKGGVVRVEGEGKLYADDLQALLKSAGIESKSVRNVIVGDGITEIGYKTFSRMRYLETLKLGAGVVRVTPGALKNCVSLEWLYLPSGLRDIGQDFLYGCDKCSVVTDAQPADLPPLENMGDAGQTYTAVDSLEKLRAAADGKRLPDALALWW